AILGDLRQGVCANSKALWGRPDRRSTGVSGDCAAAELDRCPKRYSLCRNGLRNRVCSVEPSSKVAQRRSGIKRLARAVDRFELFWTPDRRGLGQGCSPDERRILELERDLAD